MIGLPDIEIVAGARSQSLAQEQRFKKTKEVRMKKKIVWMVVSGLMALSLMMAACGQAEEGGDV